MKFKKQIIASFILFLLSCQRESQTENSNSETISKQIVDLTKQDLPKNDSTEKMRISHFEKITKDMEIRKTPFLDTTNFDNLNKTNFLSKLDVCIMQLEKIYPEFFTEEYHFKAMTSYKIPISESFHTIVLTMFKGDHEMESMLITYDLNEKIIDFLLISYDEIAEGWSRIESKMETNKVKVTKTLWLDEKREEVSLFEVDENGRFKLVSM